MVSWGVFIYWETMPTTKKRLGWVRVKYKRIQLTNCTKWHQLREKYKWQQV
jgi:hypothetical protein